LQDANLSIGGLCEPFFYKKLQITLDLETLNAYLFAWLPSCLFEAFVEFAYVSDALNSPLLINWLPSGADLDSSSAGFLVLLASWCTSKSNGSLDDCSL